MPLECFKLDKSGLVSFTLISFLILNPRETRYAGSIALSRCGMRTSTHFYYEMLQGVKSTGGSYIPRLLTANFGYTK